MVMVNTYNYTVTALLTALIIHDTDKPERVGRM